MTNGAFTDKDRERLTRTETLVEEMNKKLDKLPCVLEPPVCTQETRLKALEKRSDRWVNAAISVIVALMISGIIAISTLGWSNCGIEKPAKEKPVVAEQYDE